MFSNPFKLPTIADYSRAVPCQALTRAAEDAVDPNSWIDRDYLREIRLKHGSIVAISFAVGVITLPFGMAIVDGIWPITMLCGVAIGVGFNWVRGDVLSLIRYQDADLNIRRDCELELITAKAECNAVLLKNMSLAQSVAILVEQNHRLRVFMTASARAGADAGGDDDFPVGGDVIAFSRREH